VPASAANADRICDELREVMRGDAAFRPDVERNPNRLSGDNDQNGVLNNPDWGAFYL